MPTGHEKTAKWVSVISDLNDAKEFIRAAWDAKSCLVAVAEGAGIWGFTAVYVTEFVLDTEKIYACKDCMTGCAYAGNSCTKACGEAHDASFAYDQCMDDFAHLSTNLTTPSDPFQEVCSGCSGNQRINAINARTKWFSDCLDLCANAVHTCQSWASGPQCPVHEKDFIEAPDLTVRIPNPPYCDGGSSSLP